MAHKVSPDFNPHSLPFDRIDTPLMRTLQNASTEVQRDRLAELLNEENIDAIPQDDLCRTLQDRLQIAPNRVKHLMLELGWVSDQRKWGGKDYTRVIWLRPGYSMHNGRLRDPDGNDAVVATPDSFTAKGIEIIEDTSQPTPIDPVATGVQDCDY